MYTEHLRIPVGAGSLHAERVGRGGHPVVLLHGFGTCSFLWRGIGPRLADAGYTVIAIDLLGHGESDRPLDMSFGPAAQAEYVERALTALRLPAVSLVGQDFGGLVGLMLAATRVRRVHRLAVLGPPDLDDLPGPEIRTLQRTSARAALSANSLFGALTLLDPLLKASVAEPEHMSDRLVSRYLAPWVGSEGVGLLLQMAGAVELPEDDTGWLSDVRAPVTLVHGARDPWTTGESVTRLAAGLSGTSVRVEEMTGAGRLLAEDTPDALLALLGSWLAAELPAAESVSGVAQPAERSRIADDSARQRMV